MIALLLTATLGASAFDKVFDDSIEAYDRDDFETSVMLFEQLIEQGVVETEVFYNLGNAYYRRGYLGPAIANYERALQLDPSFQDARENLRSALNRTERALTRPARSGWEQGVYFWHAPLKAATSATVAGGFWMLSWALLGFRQIRPFPYLRRSAVAALLVALVFTGSWWVKTRPQMLAVAKDRRVAVRYGNDRSETVRFELFEGDRVLVDRSDDGWVRVLTVDEERGWAEESALLRVGPPYEGYRHRVFADLARATESRGPLP